MWTHWGRVMHICVSKLTIIDSDNGLSPGRRQAIIWTNAGILLIRASGPNFSEISSEIHTFSFKKMHSKMLSMKWRPFCLGLNELIQTYHSSYRRADIEDENKAILLGEEGHSGTWRHFVDTWLGLQHILWYDAAWRHGQDVNTIQLVTRVTLQAKIHELAPKRCQKFTDYIHRDHFVNVSSQWETMLQCNNVSYRLGTFTKYMEDIWDAFHE